jgi:hypothetical protein
MSEFDLELLSEAHDRKGFRCGSESLDRYLCETAKGHLAKGVSITRVLVERMDGKPRPILGYLTLTRTLAKAASEELVTFYATYGFIRVAEPSLRMFLPLASLC